VAVIESDLLGQLRTGAASGIATRALARPGAKILGCIGTGKQARTQIAAVCAVRPIDLETGAPWSLGTGYDGIIVANYLHRPLLPAIAQALAAGGVLIYETFARGNEQFGRPYNPDFLVRPGELLDAFAMLTVIAFEQGEVSVPRPAVIQRIAAVAGPLGRLPEPAGLDNGVPTE
jgi:hypothetical protein